MEKRPRETEEPSDAYSVPEDRALWEAVESDEVKITWGPVPDIGDYDVDDLSKDVAFMALDEAAPAERETAQEPNSALPTTAN